jgi:hypothetical protein
VRSLPSPTPLALLVLLALGALVACTPAPLTPAGARVRVIAAAAGLPRAGCALVTTLRGSAGYNGRSGETNAADVEIYLRNQAAERGGDALVITSRQLGNGDSTDSLSTPRGAGVSGGCPNCISMTASAYRCPAPAAAARPVAAPARPPAPAVDQDPPFSTRAAEAALAAAAESAKRCPAAGGPAGDARVRVTFAGTGDVVYAEVEDEPFAASPAAACVTRKLRNARVPPFAGEARSLTTTVHLGE